MKLEFKAGKIALVAALILSGTTVSGATVGMMAAPKAEAKQAQTAKNEKKDDAPKAQASKEKEKVKDKKKQAQDVLVLSSTNCESSHVSGSLSCLGIYTGNNSKSDLSGLFGENDWSDEFKIDASSGSVGFGGTTLTVSNDDKSWELSNAGTFAKLMFVLKGGNSWSAFNMDTSVLSGSWNTLSMLTGNGDRGAGLSHWSVYVAGSAIPDNDPTGNNNPPGSVPLPAAGWMLLAAIGGIAAMGRRKRA